jgi:L-fuculose-phosphate aldolase
MAAICATLWDKEWVANHDGNATARLAPGLLLATPTGISKRLITRENLIVLNEDGERVRGRMRPFSERGLHLKVYQGRSDVGAVLHAHPPHAMAWSMRATTLPSFTPEAVVSIGAETPVVGLELPGKPAEEALAPFVSDYDVVILGSHGVLSWGDDIEQAYLRMELVEHLARVALLANGVTHLPESIVAPLLKKRTSAGLGPEARKRS